MLRAENPAYPEIRIQEDLTGRILGRLGVGHAESLGGELLKSGLSEKHRDRIRAASIYCV